MNAKKPSSAGSTASPGAEVRKHKGQVQRWLRNFVALRARVPSASGGHFELAVKMGLAGGIALWVAHLLGLDYPLYVVLAVVMCMHPDRTDSINLAIVRAIGTVLGVLAVLWIVDAWGVAPWSEGVGIFVLAMVCAMPAFRDARRLAPLIFAIGTISFNTEVHNWIWGRLLATAIGCVLTVAVSAIPWPAEAEEKATRILKERWKRLRSIRSAESGAVAEGSSIDAGIADEPVLQPRVVPTEFIVGME